MPMNPRLLRPKAAASTGFDPRSINDLALWLDASDSSTITLNGSNVSAWRSKGSRTLSAAQSSASLQPTFTANAVNGFAALTCTSQARSMVVPAFPFMNTVTCFVVCEFSGPLGGFPGLFCRGALNARHLCFYNDSGQTGFIARRGTSGDSRSSLGFASGYRVFRCVFSATLSLMAVNGAEATPNTSALSYDSTDQDLTLFRLPGFGGLAGGIAEFLYYERTLGASEIQAVESGLSSKYGITLS